jgi:hypothetical protein
LSLVGNVLAYERPYLYPKQHDAIFNSKRWKLVEASTKSGKTVASIAWILEGAFGDDPGDHSWWVAPVSDQAQIAFKRIKQQLTPGSYTSRESPVPTITLINGADVSFRSADKPDSLYGEDVKRAVMDEASRSKADAWHAVRSTLTATNGQAVIIGNVKGKKNWFYEWARRVQRGLDPNARFSLITWRDAVAAHVLDVEEIDDARRNLPENVFRELYEAQASDDSGNPFGEDHIYACTREGLAPGPAVAYGIDLAKSRDWLVIIGLNERGQVCEFHRWQGRPWRESIRNIHEICGEDIPTLVDSTGVGDPVLEELQVEHGNFTGFHFGNISKQRLMEGLAVSIQSREIEFPDGPIKNELLGFEYVQIPSGIRYQAAEGYNDDCVCALALAREQRSTTAPGASLISFYASETKRAQAAAANAPDDLPDVEEDFARRFTHTVSSDEQLSNELTELYQSTLAQYDEPEMRLCARCIQAVPSTNRVTDGHSVWHPECVGHG